MSALRRTIIQLTVFSIAMGFLESSVVIYLRELYYPEGFEFPLIPIPSHLALVEFLREAATIVMLIAIGVIAGKNMTERFSFFLFCFGVWDIFYYVFLKMVLGWPESFFTWDILFLIPVPWLGPVLAPCLLSITMIILTLAVVYFHERDISVTINSREWLLLIAGTIIIIISFTWDYSQYILDKGNSVWTPLSQQELFNGVSDYVPRSFNWVLFIAGELLLVAGIATMARRHQKYRNVP